jgi:chromosomal replication initiation ATPase DnaA
MNIWDSIKQQISGKISTEAFENWLSKATFVRADADRVWVSVPDSHTRDWIQQEYAAEIWSAVRELNLPLREILYEVDNAAVLSTRLWRAPAISSRAQPRKRW